MVPIGRPREFDEQDVLERALEAFWVHGYEATSVVDLVEATGLKKGSLYQAFGDKHALLLRSLDHYLTRGRAHMQTHLAGDGALSARLRDVMTLSCSASNQKRGCFAVNCLVELAPHDADVQALLAEHFRVTERIVERAIERGIERGEVTSTVPPAALARLLQTVLTGAAASSKGHLTSPEANAVVELALASLL
jgi:TetR/AcrR family transcriptional repressor of nem operon